MTDWIVGVEAALGATLLHSRRVGGGDFAQAFQATFENGRVAFVKTHEAPPPNFFSTEATGLRWLASAQAVSVPEVLHVSDDPPCLVLAWIDVDPDGRRRDRVQGATSAEHPESDFGRALAALHAAGSACYGRDDARTTGSLALPNDPLHDWPTFHAERRLLPLARIAAERGSLPARQIERLERLASRLVEFGAGDEPPARLHGDLWAGNRIVDTQGKSWLVDPAAHGGHREFDLAMMRLFGGFDERCHAAYHEVSPLAPGWRERVPLHQLAPLVVHAIKFGGGYIRGVGDALDACA